MARITVTSTTPDVLATLGGRLREYRLQQDIPMADLAAATGIAVRTLARAELTGEMTLTTFVKVLRGLGRLDALDAVLPPASQSPVALLRRAGYAPERASRRGKSI